MKEVLKLIEQKKLAYFELPFFQFLQDKSIDPLQRLSFAPCVAPFSMGFAELNKSVFREDPTDNPIQEIINRHTKEDDHHWLWYFEDLRQLELDQSMKFTDSLKFLWSEETKVSRKLVYELYKYTYKAPPIEKLVVIEVIEATGNVASSFFAQVSHEVKVAYGKECLYFGDVHLAVETGRTVGNKRVEKFIDDIQLDDETRMRAFELVEIIYELFIELTNALLSYAQKYIVSQANFKQHEIGFKSLA